MYFQCKSEKRCAFYYRVINILGHVSPCRLAQYVHHKKIKSTPFFTSAPDIYTVQITDECNYQLLNKYFLKVIKVLSK